MDTSSKIQHLVETQWLQMWLLIAFSIFGKTFSFSSLQSSCLILFVVMSMSNLLLSDFRLEQDGLGFLGNIQPILLNQIFLIIIIMVAFIGRGAITSLVVLFVLLLVKRGMVLHHFVWKRKILLLNFKVIMKIQNGGMKMLWISSKPSKIRYQQRQMVSVRAIFFP